VVDADILAVINKLAKQRKDSIEQYSAGNRVGVFFNFVCQVVVMC
jgi:uncharacterized protein YqeY